MTLAQHYQVSLFLTTASAGALTIWIIIQKPRSRVAQLFSLYSLGIVLWTFIQAIAPFVGDAGLSISLFRWMFRIVIFFPLILNHLFSAFLGVSRKKVLIFGWVLAISFFPLISSDSFLQAGETVGFLPMLARNGPLFLPFNLVWLSWFLYDMYFLISESRKTTKVDPRQVAILATAYSLGYLTGCTNYLYFYGIYLPGIQPFFSYGVSLAYLLFTYGIFAYKLFEIQIVIRKSLIYSMLVASLTITYLLVVLVVEKLLQGIIGYRSLIGAIMAAGVVAVGFMPLRNMIQGWVDRLILGASQENLVRENERLRREIIQTERLGAIATLATGMAHEIKNPLASIKTFAEYMPRRLHDAEFLEKFARIVPQEVTRINALVQRMLEFAKPKPPEREPVRLGRLVDETAELLHQQFVAKRVTLARAYSQDDIVMVDPAQMKQVLLNIFLNSLEAMEKPGGCITVATVSENGHLHVVIADTGPGIEPQDLPRVFDPFFTRKPLGTGLGLSVVHSILAEHGGRIRLDSQRGRGTTVYLELPKPGGV